MLSIAALVTALLSTPIPELPQPATATPTRECVVEVRIADVNPGKHCVRLSVRLLVVDT